MKMKNLVAFLLALCLLFCLCACDVKEDSPSKNTTNATADTSITEPTNLATDEPTVATEPVKEPSYIVKVIDEGGNAVVGAMVMICQGENCSLSDTDDTGVAKFFDKEEADYEVKFASIPTGYDYISEEQVFHFPEGSNELTITLQAVA